MATKRKPSSGQIPQARSVSQSKGPEPPKFYDGPTVMKASGKVTDKGKEVLKKGVTVVEKGGKDLKAKAKTIPKPTRRTYTLLNLSLLLLTLLSFFSLTFCPPPPTHSKLSALNPFSTLSRSSSLEQLLCTPTNSYRSNILDPYIVPRLQNRKAQIVGHPLYKAHVDPALAALQKKVIKPYVIPYWMKLQKMAKKNYKLVNRKYIKPNLPLLKRRLHHAEIEIKYQLRPIITRVSAWSAVVHRNYDKIVTNPNLVSTKRQLVKTYKKARPTVEKMVRRGENVLKRTVVPKLAGYVEKSLDLLERLWQELSRESISLYHTRIQPLLHPHLSKASSTIYQPYLAPHHTRLSPYLSKAKTLAFGLIMTPSWASVRTGIRESFTSLSGGVVEKVVQAKESVVQAAASVSSAISSAIPSATPVVENREKKLFDAPPSKVAMPPPGEGKEEKKVREAREEEEAKVVGEQIEEGLRVLEGRVQKAGRAKRVSLEKLIKEMVDKYRKTSIPPILSTKLSPIQDLFGNISFHYASYIETLNLSPDLPDDEKAAKRVMIKEGAKQGMAMAEKTRDEFKQEVDEGLIIKGIVDMVHLKISKAVKEIQGSVAEDSQALAHKMTWYKYVTAKMWARHQNIDKAAREFGDDYNNILATNVKPIQSLQSEILSEVSTMTEDLRAEMLTIEKNANGQIDGKMNILPIDTGIAAMADSAMGAIGKGKEQVVEALKAAEAAIHPSATKDSVADQVRAAASQASVSAASIAAAAASVAHEGTRAASRAVGATPSPESAAEYIESAAAVVSSAISSAVVQASSSVHSATRVVGKAVGATPAAEGILESAEDIASAISQQGSSILESASSIVHQATRSASSYVGATPTPENAAEHLAAISAGIEGVGQAVKSVVVGGVDNAASLAAKATESVKQVVKDEL